MAYPHLTPIRIGFQFAIRTPPGPENAISPELEHPGLFIIRCTALAVDNKIPNFKTSV